jgi:hypothetical protein
MKIWRRASNHGPDVGSSSVVHVQVGSLMVAFERFVGVYGFRDSVTYGVKFGWHPYRG